MKKYDLSRIMKRAWELVRKVAMTMSEALKTAWVEAKEIKKELTKTLKENLEEMAYNCIYINAGIERVVKSKIWEKNGKKRMYLTIDCFTASGRSKGSYKCGYVDMLTNTYVTGKWDDVDALNRAYVGK